MPEAILALRGDPALWARSHGLAWLVFTRRERGGVRIQAIFESGSIASGGSGRLRPLVHHGSASSGRRAARCRDEGVLRRRPRAHRLLVRRLHERLAHHARRRLRVGAGQADPVRHRRRDEDPAAARLLRRVGPRRVHGRVPPDGESREPAQQARPGQARHVEGAGRRDPGLRRGPARDERGRTRIPSSPIRRSAGRSGRRSSRPRTASTRPGEFTTFPAFEWTSNPNKRNLHRVVVFASSKGVPELPFSALDSDDPEALWSWMASVARQGRHAARDPAQRQRQRRADVLARDAEREAALEGLHRDARGERAALRGLADQGHLGDQPRSVAERRVRRLRAVGLHALGRRRAPDASQGQLRAAGLPRRALARARGAWQPVPLRSDRRLATPTTPPPATRRTTTPGSSRSRATADIGSKA